MTFLYLSPNITLNVSFVIQETRKTFNLNYLLKFMADDYIKVFMKQANFPKYISDKDKMLMINFKISFAFWKRYLS